MAAPRQQIRGDEQKDRTPGLGAAAIVLAFLFPPAGLIYARRCLYEAGKRRASKNLAYTALGFVLVGLTGWSVVFAILTRHFPLNVGR